jgi:NAD(P)H-dependent FMN reductase
MKLAVVLGTVREGRLSERLAQWVVNEAAAREGTEVELIDLKDYPMPFFDEPISPILSGRLRGMLRSGWLSCKRPMPIFM